MGEFQAVLLSVVLQKMKRAGSPRSPGGWTGGVNIPESVNLARGVGRSTFTAAARCLPGQSMVLVPPPAPPEGVQLEATAGCSQLERPGKI